MVVRWSGPTVQMVVRSTVQMILTLTGPKIELLVLRHEEEREAFEATPNSLIVGRAVFYIFGELWD